MGESAPTFHVVCRECQVEGVESSEGAAALAAVQHRSQAGHRVVFDRFE